MSQMAKTGVLCLWGSPTHLGKLSVLPIAHCSVNCIIKRPSSCRAAASALRRTSARSKPSVCYEEPCLRRKLRQVCCRLASSVLTTAACSAPC